MASKYSCIGAGFCGTVWALFEDGQAIKREDGGSDRSLANDYAMHQRILQSFTRLTDIKRRSGIHQTFPQVRVSQCHHFISPNDQWWTKNLPLFPSQYSPCNAIVSDRIRPFAEPIRKLVVDKFCNPAIQTEILTSAANSDCLIRPYLDQMEDIGILTEDMQSYARTMGEALATLHWLGEVDGNDVEFVMAPPPFHEEEPNTNTITNVLGRHTMWMLDFDLCRYLPMSDAGVQQAVTAFWRNDPFYPRPQSKLWANFREQYLMSSGQIINEYSQVDIDERLSFARDFIGLIETK
ncbi:hypothetical protein BO83DRAFT_373420 [Aspergillus eucalypticola CBS 122712]|uniref:DUF3669 domain-containing protein n=1 Tax=Aspergillus eucalypticola (strain CBS 122712 / IBT 29274) TaxID=1448314 RepID=A0A317UJN1_ASPEC|nr:uncharacterized protein BO83DRAFT_373420 [Aspergillus eucalypticola CBS 122712]PWY61901.1 hypothetical protein BO83DRAFT_373420 [Aspergillus eucalypticola CBS 122712]